MSFKKRPPQKHLAVRCPVCKIRMVRDGDILCKTCQKRMECDREEARRLGIGLEVFDHATGAVPKVAPCEILEPMLTLGRVVDILEAASRNGGTFTTTQISSTCFLERIVDPTSGASLFRISCCSEDELRDALSIT